MTTRQIMRGTPTSRATIAHKQGTAPATARAVAALIEGAPSLWAIVNAYNGPFTSSWHRGSRHLLDRLENHWNESVGEPGERLAYACDAARDGFQREVLDVLGDALFGWEEDDPLSAAWSGIMMAFDQRVAHVRWVGGDHVFLLRGGQCIWHNRAHILRDHVSAAPTPLHFALMRVFDTSRPGPERFDEARVELVSGDRLIMLSAHINATATPPMSAGGELLEWFASLLVGVDPKVPSSAADALDVIDENLVSARGVAAVLIVSEILGA